MKKSLLAALALAMFAASLLSSDQVVVSSTTKVVEVEVTKEWRTITFTLDPDTHEVSVRAYYERVVREDGVVKKRDGIRETTLQWAAATNIAPALIAVREQFNAALPTVLADTH